MKTLTYFLALVPGILAAQTYQSYEYYYFNQIQHTKQVPELIRSEYAFDYMQGVPVEQLTTTVSTPSGKIKQQKIYQLNKAGKPTKIIYEGGTIETIEYDESDTLVIHKERVYKKHTHTSSFQYNSGNIALIESFSDNKLTNRTIVQYNEQQLVSFTSISGKSKRKAQSMLYAYDGDKLKEQRWMRNNKVVKRWDYGCVESGTEIKDEETTSVCHYNEENNDGSYIRYKRSITKEGVTLSKNYFTADSVWYQSEYFDHNNQLTSKNVKEGNVSINTTYDKSGKISRIYSYERDAQNRMVAYSFKNKRQVETYGMKYTYNPDGTLAKRVSTHKGKEHRIHTYNYQLKRM